MKIDEATAERLRAKTVNVLLELRAAYLANGANPLKHWTQLEERTKAACRTTGSVEEWVTAVKRNLQVNTTSSALSSAAISLRDEVAVSKVKPSKWLDLIEKELGLIMALAREEAEDRKQQREARNHEAAQD